MIVKRLTDIAISLLVLTLAAPILLVAALLIQFGSKGGVFFRQRRLGKDGKVFLVYKFRTMVEGAQNQGTGLFSYQDDDRITPIGKYMRLTSIDEFPQFINVLKGEMSVVGPRPAVEFELGRYEDMSSKTRARFVVKPGITGLAQITGRNALTWDKKIDLDLKYIENRRRYGFLYDLYIIALTPLVVLSANNVIEEEEK